MSSLHDVSSKERLKLDAKSRQCIFLGYPKGVKRFKLWDQTTNKVVISRDVIFDKKNLCYNVLRQKRNMC